MLCFYLNSWYIIGWNVADLSDPIDHLPPVLLFCVGLVQNEVVVLFETKCFSKRRFEVVKSFEHLITLCNQRKFELTSKGQIYVQEIEN